MDSDGSCVIIWDTAQLELTHVDRASQFICIHRSIGVGINTWHLAFTRYLFHIFILWKKLFGVDKINNKYNNLNTCKYMSNSKY